MTVYTLDTFGNACADFSAISSLAFAWPASNFTCIEFHLFNVSQSVTQALLSMQVSTNGSVTFDSNIANYKTVGQSVWTEGIVQLANITEGQWPVSVDMGDVAAYGCSGVVTLKTSGVAGGNNVHSSYDATIKRTDSGNNILKADQSGYYIGAPGTKINGVRFFFPDMTYSPTMSGKIIARGVF